MARSVRLSVVALALCAIATACSDMETTNPRATANGGPLLEIYDPAVDVGVLQRTTPLATDLTASATIGKSGGRIEIVEAGLRVDFPSNSVRSNTKITITALKGTNVAYVFEPHGLVFKQDPLIRQAFKGTNAFNDHTVRDALEGAYFPDTTYVVTGHAKIVETRPTFVDVTGSSLRFSVNHFSGYLVSTGRMGGYISSTGNRIPNR